MITIREPGAAGDVKRMPIKFSGGYRDTHLL